jgi:Tfp pilus assembly protein PilV
MAKLKGSALVEIMIAMVIILCCSTMATLIYMNILQSQNTSEKLRAFYILQKTAAASEQKADFLDAELSEGGFIIRKTCRPYNGRKNLIELKLNATNERGKVVSELNKVILQK